MGSMIQKIYETAFDIWNSLITVAMTLFNTSPLEASSGTLVSAISPVYTVLLDIGLITALLFFLIAIIKETMSAPPGQQIQRMFLSAIRYGVILGILAKLWEIMKIIIQITDYITSASAGTADVSLSLADDAKTLITNYFTNTPDFDWLDIAGSIANWFTYAMMSILFFILSIVTLFIVIASVISIISSAFQRILKPLVIMPFGAIMVAAGAGTGDSERAMWSYLKTFIGFCLSGAVMVICIRLGVTLCNGISITGTVDVTSTDTGVLTQSMLYLTVQTAVTPIVVAGLIKSVDSIIARFL